MIHGEGRERLWKITIWTMNIVSDGLYYLNQDKASSMC